MDYEKKYKEALERARQFSEKPYLEDSKGIVDYIFHELKDSEDERIRKELIDIVAKSPITFAFEDKKKVLAWLEKQGEQKPIIEMKSPEESLGIDSDTYNKIVDECIYGEQKPTDNVEPKFKVGQTIKKEGFNSGFPIVKIEDGFYYNDMGDYFPFTDQDNWELVEQKPAWSEEDETKLKSACALIRNTLIRNTSLNGNKDIIDSTIDFLKSLKERVQPQNRWKESLVTADLENSLCDIQDGFSDTSYEYRALGEAIEFIRCTESKPQWKPSDEQVEALRKAESTIGVNHVVLAGLISDLEKLKG